MNSFYLQEKLYLCFLLLLQMVLSTYIQSQTGTLLNFNGYTTVSLIHFNVPPDTSLASFQLTTTNKISETDCLRQNVNVVIKRGSPAVINQDGFVFPSGFFNFSRPETYFANISSDTQVVNIKLTNPTPGKYFISAFLPAVDLRDENARSMGCSQSLDISFYTIRKKNLRQIYDRENVRRSLSNNSEYFKMSVPPDVDHVLLKINNETYCDDCDFLFIKVNRLVMGPYQQYVVPLTNSRNESTKIQLWTVDNTWYYFQFQFIESKNNISRTNKNGLLSFEAKYIPTIVTVSNKSIISNSSDYFLKMKRGVYRNEFLSYRMFYNEYLTIMRRMLAAFAYFYHLGSDTTPFTVQINSREFISIPFEIKDELDVGGTIRISASYINESSEFWGKNFRIIGCIRRDFKEVPVWPSLCMGGEEQLESPFLFNTFVTSTTVYIPFPEPGRWFLTFRLFCDNCTKCNCLDTCQSFYKSCTEDCEDECASDNACGQCSETCRESTINMDGCSKCDCEGGCLTDSTSCNATIQVEIASSACIDGSCGRQGSCVLLLNHGFALSTCNCRNNHRGWDCLDDTHANPFGMVALEFLLLTISNIAFVPSAIISFKRRYYVPCIMYSFVFIASTIYHMCDAGESIITYCILPHGALQFADFFCAMVALWTTLVSIGYVSSTLESILYVSGTVAIAIGVRINMMSVWFYTSFAVVSAAVILISWSFKFKVKNHYPKRTYLLINLPVGLVMLTLGLLLFGLATTSTYKYFHSLWHMLMAVAVFIVLPKKNFFINPR